MIDNDDASWFGLASMSTGGWLGLVFFIIFIVFKIQACNNIEKCSTMKCDIGTPKLVKNECLCVQRAK